MVFALNSYVGYFASKRINAARQESQVSLEKVTEDINLIDVIEMIVDCVMAGLARSGEVYPLDINPDVLLKAFQNTVEMLKENVIITT